MPATTGTYYFSSSSFSNATALYTDVDLTTFAPDGWYSDQTIYRQQAAGVLYAETTCPNCLGPAPTPAPSVTPAPTATPTPAPTGTPAPTVTPTPVSYDYRIYNLCGTSTTQVFRILSGGLFPAVVKYNSKCWENPTATASTSTVDIAGLPSYVDCATCNATTPTPVPTATPVPTITPAPTVASTQIFSTYTVGNGDTSSAACVLQTQYSMYTTRANVASIQVGDIMYTNASRTNVWNGGLSFYGVTNVNSHYPNLDNGYALLINSLGVVDGIVNCMATPTPSPVPTAAPQTNVELRLCGTTTPTYDVRVNGDYTDPSNIGRALTLGSGGGVGSCPVFDGTQCWEIVNVDVAAYDCTATVTATSSSCGGCAPTPIYDYATYTECYTSTTQVFRKFTTTASWPNVVEYNVGGNDLCFSFTSTTTGTSTVSIEPLTSHTNCFDCESANRKFVSGFAGNGLSSDTLACAASTPAYIFTSRANVSLIQVGDIMYANSSLSTPFNGGLQWYGVSNVQGQQYSDYALLILSTGVVQAIVNCSAPTPAPVPAPLPTPAPVATQEISVVQCGTSSPTYYVEVIGASGLSVGRGIKFSSGGSTGGCPTFDDTQCYEVTGVNIGFHNCQGIVSQVSNSCSGLSGCVSPTPAPTPAPSPTPAPISYQYLDITRCDGGTNNYTIVRTSPGTFPTNSSVLMPDGFCYLVVDPSLNTTTQEGLAWYTECIPCQSATPAPAPTPAPVVSVYYYQLTNCPSHLGTFTEIASTTILNPGSAVKMSDGLCYQVEDAVAIINSNTAVATYADCITCNATTPTPAPSPTPAPTIAPTPAPIACIGIEVGYSTGLYYGCCVPPDNFGIKYFNANSVATATRLYDDFTCSTLESGTIYVSEDSSTYYEFFNGVKSAGPTSCPSCP